MKLPALDWLIKNTLTKKKYKKNIKNNNAYKNLMAKG